MSDKLKLLLVDDEMHVRMIIKVYLSSLNIDIIEARDGREALEELKHGGIDIVILDYTMPIMDGQEVINWMLLDKRMDKVPVVIYTAGGFDKEIEDKLKATSTAFIEKSNLGNDLLPIVQDILGNMLSNLEN